MTRPDDTLRVRVAYVLVGTAITFALGALSIYIAVGEADRLMRDWALHNITVTVFIGVVAALGIRAAPRNGAAWALAWSVVFSSLQAIGAATGLAIEGFSNADIQALEVAAAPSQLAPLAAVGFNLALWTWVPALFIVVTFGLLLFPNGTLPSPRWRWVAGLSALALVLGAGPFAWGTRPWSEVPYAEALSNEGAVSLAEPGLLLLIILSVLSLLALVMRTRRSSGEERLQYRWGLWGLGALAASTVVLVYDTRIFQVVSLVVIVNAALSFGVAITRYRLYDIDIVISRALAFVALAAFITGIYVAIVVGIGTAFAGSSLGLSVAATALVAVAFEPVRARVQKWANRLVYGRRATPYEVLSDLTGRLADTESEEGLLGRMAQRLSAGTGAERATVWLSDGTGLQAAAVAPPNGELTARVDSLEALPGVAVPIEHEGERLGALTVEKRHGEALSPTERLLIRDLAGSAGLVMRRLLLDEALATKAGELEESRRRLVDAQDVERRRLERDLHDGAQQNVVAIRLRLRIAEKVARSEGADRAAFFIDQMTDDAQSAIDQIRALAQGIYPPLLEAEGLGGAIPALADFSPLEVRVVVDVPQRHSLPLEGAVYFCVSEALTNASKHAAGPVAVDVSQGDDGLTFTVTDSGNGFDPAKTPRGTGLTNMADRIDALGGTLAISSEPGSGTTISGTLPSDRS